MSSKDPRKPSDGVSTSDDGTNGLSIDDSSNVGEDAVQENPWATPPQVLFLFFFIFFINFL